MQGYLGKLVFVVIAAFLWMAAPRAHAENPCLQPILDAIFEENDIGEIEAVIVLRRLEAALVPLNVAERRLLVERAIQRLDRDLSDWEFARRDYLGGVLFVGPTGNLRWLSPHGCWMRAYLPSDYWQSRKLTDTRYPKAKELGKLEWDVLVPCPNQPEKEPS